MKDDIEILDIFDTKKKTVQAPVEETVPKKRMDMHEPPKKKKKVKAKAFQVLFCSVSFLFILGCLIYYGSRFIKYYRIYNPKVDAGNGEVLLAKSITGNSEIVYEGDGLYSSSGNYIYKGDVKNNYIKYNNMLWRIVKINMDNSIEIILDDYVSILPWHKSSVAFTQSDMYEYLNKTILNNLDKEMLVKNSICEDKIDDLSNITCDNQNNEIDIKLLDITGFLNSVKDGKSYLVKSDEIFWLSDYNDNKVWHTNGINISKSDANTFYEVRPVVKLKNTVTYKEGEGTLDSPYIVDKETKLSVGSTVVLGEDEWLVYDVNDGIRLMRKNVLSEKHLFDKNNFEYNPGYEDSLAEYLNTTYLDSLSYKNMIVNTDWYIGSYKDSLKDIKGNKVLAKVGIPSLLDIKLDSSINAYYLLTSHEDIIYVYENPLRPSRVTSKRDIRPCITISKDDANKLKLKDGKFVVEE